MNLTGTVTTYGELRQTFEELLVLDEEFDSSGNRTFTGRVSGNMLSTSF